MAESWNVWRYAAVRAGLRGQATFARQDLWKSDMSKYDNVVIFGVEQMMEQLEEKLEKEMKEGSTVVACRFHLVIIPQLWNLLRLSLSWFYVAGFNFLHGNLLMKLVVEWILFGDIKGSVKHNNHWTHWNVWFFSQVMFVNGTTALTRNQYLPQSNMCYLRYVQ